METEKLATRIGKLLSGTRKPDEGFATIFVYEPRDFLEKKHGNLYFAAEVASGSKSAASVGETIINSIKKEFYQDLDRSVILSFESALRRANEELSDLASAGETDWVGKLNVTCAVLSEDKIHLSKVGATEAYIVRGEKITHISEGLNVEDEGEDDKHPLKTFSTITSGTLQKGDKLILSSPDLFYHISLAGLKKLVSENKPHGAISKLKELLKDEEGIGSIGVLIIDITTEEELSKERYHETDEVWIEEPKPSQKALGVAGSLLGASANLFKKGAETIKGKVSGKAADQELEKEKPIESLKEEEELGESEDASSARAETAPAETSKEFRKEKQENFVGFVVNYFKNFSLANFSKDTKRVFGNLKSGFKEKTRSIYFKLFLVVAILFVASLLVIVRNYYINKNIKGAKVKLDQAISLESKAEGALIYEARDEAKGYLNESKSLTAEVLKTKYYNKEALDLVAKINESMKKADGIFEVTPNVALEIDKDIETSSFTFLDKNLYFVNSKNNKLISYNIDQKEQKTRDTTSSQATFSQISAFPKKGTIILCFKSSVSWTSPKRSPGPAISPFLAMGKASSALD